MIVAVDGPVAAGKGTLARRLAAHFGYAHLDTGLLYRATALRLIRGGRESSETDAAVHAASSLQLEDLTDPALRDENVGEMSSVVAAIPDVRDALVEFQRNFANSPPNGEPGAVLDGRDIGTVIYPDADIKLFVTAAIETRAKRRYDELVAQGKVTTLKLVLENLRRRDDRDGQRSIAPLKPADDAYLLDTTNLDIEAAFQDARDYVASFL